MFSRGFVANHLVVIETELEQALSPSEMKAQTW